MRTVAGRLLLGIAVAVLGGCATRPPPAPVPESFLLTDYPAWFALDVAGNREMVRGVLNTIDPDLAGIVDRTDRIVGGFRTEVARAAGVSAVATGRFAPGGIRLALGTNRSFERRVVRTGSSRHVYYQQQPGELQFAIARRDTLYLSSGRILEMLDPRPPADLELDPDVFRTLRSVGQPGEPGAVVVFDDPGSGLFAPLGMDAPGLPVSRVTLSLWDAEDGRYELGLRLTVRSERDAVLFARVGRLFVVVFARAIGVDGPDALQTTTSVDGANVSFRGLSVDAGQLAVLLARTGGAP